MEKSERVQTFRRSRLTHRTRDELDDVSHWIVKIKTLLKETREQNKKRKSSPGPEGFEMNEVVADLTSE